MELRQCLFTENRYYKYARYMKPKGIMIHSTGANNPYLKRYVGPDDGLLGRNQYGNHWNTSKAKYAVHAFIGKLNDGSVAAYQVMPWVLRVPHCGFGRNGSANNTHISFEICEDNLQDSEYFNAVYTEAVELTAWLCKLYGFDPTQDGVVICHSEGHERGIASGHADVMHWFPRHGKSMDTFREDVAKLMQEDKNKPSEWAKKSWEKATNAGVFDGTRPQDAMTREQVATVLDRLGLMD